MGKFKVIPFLIAFVLIFAFQPATPAVEAKGDPFPDMPKFGQSEVKRLKSVGILQGNPDGTLRPNDQVTRAEAVTLIGRALKLDGSKRSTTFTDVPSNHYASGYIATGVESGLISGTSATTFSPNDKVTRAQMAVFLQRAFKLSKTRPDVFYKDVSSSTFGSSAINAITTARVSAGYQDGTFGPNKGTTRVEFSLFLARALYPEYKLPEYVPNEDLVASNSTRATVYNAADGLNIRSTPDTSRPPVGKLKNGDTVSYYATVGNWAVFTYEGKPAYVSLSYLKSSTPPGNLGSSGGSSSAGSGLKGKVIVVDAGHGAHDGGAAANGLKEKDLALAISLKLRDKLQAAGAKVIMTRSTDVFLELKERVAIANNNNADSFISVHINSAGIDSANGTETYWHRKYASADSKKLATEIQREMMKKLDTRDRGVKEGNFHVIRESKMSSVLVEVGFISNKAEAQKMATAKFQNDAAEAIMQGVKNFYK